MNVCIEQSDPDGFTDIRADLYTDLETEDGSRDIGLRFCFSAESSYAVLVDGDSVIGETRFTAAQATSIQARLTLAATVTADALQSAGLDDDTARRVAGLRADGLHMYPSGSPGAPRFTVCQATGDGVSVVIGHAASEMEAVKLAEGTPL